MTVEETRIQQSGNCLLYIILIIVINKRKNKIINDNNNNMASTLKILRGGNICNGDGNTKIFKGDVYIVNQHIQKVVAWENGVAPLCPSNAELVDCQGKLVAPGWIDQHTHYDGQVTWDPYLSPSASAGVTTASK